MPHYEAKTSSKGQITVPAEVRSFLGLKEGDRVDFYIDPSTRRVQIIARNAKLADLRGVVPPPNGRPVTQEEIDRGIGEYLSEKHERISQEWNEWREFQNWRRRNAKKAAG
ncbi:MAG: AbrB/MazE/SpoVT family DNA-binding domain-containing protein [Bauldia sp.]|nr:AbrB/MazE/SpoVT family DNA-binding domain-containing protein [Bauldia sp.]